MAETTIEWADFTFNPWMGCTKVSPACANCYAERDFDHRYGKVKWGPNGTRVVTSDANWQKPLKWNRDAAERINRCNGSHDFIGDRCMKCGCDTNYRPARPRVFCASLADVFETWDGPILNSKGGVLLRSTDGMCIGNLNDDPRKRATMDDLRKQLFELIDATPYLDWLLLTKRPENIRRMWPDKQSMEAVFPGMAAPLGEPMRCFKTMSYRPNVWLGTTVENQEYADKRIPELLKCRDLSPVLFLSCEPMTGPIDLPGDVYCHYCEDACPDLETNVVECRMCDGTGIRHDTLDFEFDWVIAGGESGPDARPANPDWFRSLRDQCKAAGVPFLFKQWGAWSPYREDIHAVCVAADNHGFDDDSIVFRVGKKAAGRLLDGVEHNGFPKSLKEG